MTSDGELGGDEFGDVGVGLGGGDWFSVVESWRRKLNGNSRSYFSPTRFKRFRMSLDHCDELDMHRSCILKQV